MTPSNESDQAGIAVPPRINPNKVVWIDYTNYRGERRIREITPHVLFFGKIEPYYPSEQWLLNATDMERGVMRTFAMEKIHAWSHTPLVDIAKECESV